MLIDICENPNIVYCWLSQAEKQNADIQNDLTAKRKEWNKNGYRVCTFISGAGNLVDLTKELLIQNRDALIPQNDAESISASADA